MKISSGKAKGRKLQKWVCEKVSDVTGFDWGYEDDKLIQPRIMGQKGVDVILRGEAYDWFKYDIECKNQEKWAINKAIKQAMNNTKEGREWLLVMKRNNIKPVVILDADHFFNLIKNSSKGKNNDLLYL